MAARNMPSNKSLSAQQPLALSAQRVCVVSRFLCAQASPSRLSLSFRVRPLEPDGYIINGYD